MAYALEVGGVRVAVRAIVTGLEPQSKVMIPPAFTAAERALSVQLAAVPVPTTVVGFEVSTGWPSAGIPVEHDPSGLPFGMLPLLEPLELEVEVVPELEPELEVVPVAPVPLDELLASLPPLPPVPVVPFVELLFDPHAADAKATHASAARAVIVGREFVRKEWQGMGSSVRSKPAPIIGHARGGCRGLTSRARTQR